MIQGETQYDQPFSAFPTDYASLPNVSFVSPNDQNNMHDGTPQQADSWIASNLQGYADWAKTHNSALIVTTDENSNTGGSGPGQVDTIVNGAGVTPGSYGGTYDHYSLGATLAASQGTTGPGADASAPVFSGMFNSAPVQAALNPTSSIGPVSNVKTAASTGSSAQPTTGGSSMATFAPQNTITQSSVAPTLV
jgi:hypothetical protein